MATQIFVNLPVRDLPGSVRFWAEVDGLVAKARAAGGTVPRDPKDYGFMYGHGFEDLDGHLWELVYMEPGGAKCG